MKITTDLMQEIFEAMDRGLNESNPPDDGGYDIKKDAESRGLVPVGATNWAKKEKTTGEPNERGFYELKPGQKADYKKVRGRLQPIDHDGTDAQQDTEAQRGAPETPPSDQKYVRTRGNPLTDPMGDDPMFTPKGDNSPVAKTFSSNATSKLDSFRNKFKETQDRKFGITKKGHQKLTAAVNQFMRAEKNLNKGTHAGIAQAEGQFSDFIERVQLRELPDSNRTLVVDGLGVLPPKVRKMFDNSSVKRTANRLGVYPLKSISPDGTLNWKGPVEAAARSGFEGEVSAEESDSLKEIFDKSKVMKSMKGMHKQVYGIKDESGNFVRSGGQASIKYLKKHLKDDTTVDNIIDALQDHKYQFQRLQATGAPVKSNLIRDVDDLTDSLEHYKSAMDDLAESHSEYTKKEFSEKLGSLYAETATELFMINDSFGSAILKGMAENFMYYNELANGEEVYLPSSNSFPGADKIIVGQDEEGEQMSFVQVKYGIGSDMSAGFKTDASKYTMYSSREDYRDLLSTGAGEHGYDLGVKSEYITMKEDFDRVLNDSGISKAVVDADGLHGAMSMTVTEVARKREEFRQKLEMEDKKLSKDRLTKMIHGEEMAQAIGTLNDELYHIIDFKELEKIWGESNVKEIRRGGPVAMMKAIAFSAVLNTSDGISSIRHNSQFIHNDKFTSYTSKGSPSLKDWSIEYSTAGGTIGVLRAGMKVDPEKLL